MSPWKPLRLMMSGRAPSSPSDPASACRRVRARRDRWGADGSGSRTSVARQRLELAPCERHGLARPRRTDAREPHAHAARCWRRVVERGCRFTADSLRVRLADAEAERLVRVLRNRRSRAEAVSSRVKKNVAAECHQRRAPLPSANEHRLAPYRRKRLVDEAERVVLRQASWYTPRRAAPVGREPSQPARICRQSTPSSRQRPCGSGSCPLQAEPEIAREDFHRQPWNVTRAWRRRSTLHDVVTTSSCRV